MQITKKRLKQIIKEELVRLAEVNQDPTAVSSAIEDINRILETLSPHMRESVMAAFTVPQK